MRLEQQMKNHKVGPPELASHVLTVMARGSSSILISQLVILPQQLLMQVNCITFFGMELQL